MIDNNNNNINGNHIQNNNNNSNNNVTSPSTQVRERTLSSSGRIQIHIPNHRHTSNGNSNGNSVGSSGDEEEYYDTSSDDEIDIINDEEFDKNDNESRRLLNNFNTSNGRISSSSSPRNYSSNNNISNGRNNNSNNNSKRGSKRSKGQVGCCSIMNCLWLPWRRKISGKSYRSINNSNKDRKLNILCIGITIMITISMFLLLMLLMRVPVSYTDQEDYSDRILTSYCRFGLFKNKVYPNQLQTSCVFNAATTNKNPMLSGGMMSKLFSNEDYDCTPASVNRISNFRYEMELPEDSVGISTASSLTTSSVAVDPFSCQRPIVSVIVPIYNVAVHQLEELVHSLERQSLQAFEILVVDDCSTDQALLDYISKWQARDGRVIIQRHSSNRGLSAARNTGIRKSRANYLFFIDGDDMIEPTTLEKLAWKLESTPEIYFTKGYTVGFGAQNYTWNKGFEESTRFLEENQVTATIMFRKEVFIVNNVGRALTSHSAGTPLFNGYDENIIGGLEDWDFLLRLAEKGYWGETIPEHLDWYRRKDKETSKLHWSNFKEEKKQEFLNGFKLKYPLIHSKSFPKIEKKDRNYQIQSSLNFHNPIKKVGPRLLLIVPWFNTGGADKFNLNLIKQLIQKGWEVSIVATLQSDNQWLNEFKSLTSDIFILNNFLSIYDFPRFLCYMIESRRIDITMVTNSEIGYLFIPYLRERCPYSSIVDYIHMEENEWKNGGFARYSLSLQSQLDLSIVSSDHLKEWMIKKGTKRFAHTSHQTTSTVGISGNNNNHNLKSNKQHEKEYIQYTKSLNDNIDVSYINVDTDEFFMNLVHRSSVRTRYSIPSGQHPVILFAARMTEQKQPMIALEVFKELILRNATFTALVSGDGPLRDTMEEFVQRNGMSDHVKMLGVVQPNDMKKVISASDIVFLPSKMEGIAMIFFEAMAAGVVPVGAKVGGQSELISPDEGILLDKMKLLHRQQEIDQYSHALESLINDPQHLNRLGKNCQEKIRKHFKLDMMGDKMITLFCKASSNKRERDEEDDPLIGQAYTPLRSYGVGVEMAIQAIESMKWQKKSEDMWKQLEAHRKRVEDDQQYHNQCNIDRSEMSRLKSELTKLEEEHKKIKLDFDQYVEENEIINTKYEDLKIKLNQQQKQEKKEIVNENNNLDENKDQ